MPLEAGDDLFRDMEGLKLFYNMEEVRDAKRQARFGIGISVVSILIAIAVGQSMEVKIMTSVIVGIAAVPVAPLAKDLAGAINAARKALGNK